MSVMHPSFSGGVPAKGSCRVAGECRCFSSVFLAMSSVASAASPEVDCLAGARTEWKLEHCRGQWCLAGNKTGKILPSEPNANQLRSAPTPDLYSA